MGLGRPDASVGESGRGEHPRTPRWLTHEICKARAQRPSSRSWPLAHRARRLHVETTMNVAGPSCCTNSSRSTGRPSSSEPNSPAACLISSSRSSRRTYAAACSSTASLTWLAASVASRWPWRTRARSEGSARRARAGAWRMSRSISSMKCSPRPPCGSGCARCRGGCATRWATTVTCVPTCSTRSSSRCAFASSASEVTPWPALGRGRAVWCRHLHPARRLLAAAERAFSLPRARWRVRER
jgi:hypothetical protein